MADKCPKCDCEVASKDAIKCNDCPVVCHTRCVGVVTRNKKWKCDACTVDSASNSSKMSDSGASNVAILEAISAFRKENNDRWDSNKEAMSQVISDVNSIKTDVGGLKEQFKGLHEKCEINSTNIVQVRAENERLSGEVARMRQQIADLEQHSRKSNLLVTGVPVTKHEDVFSILDCVARALKITFQASDISAAHRLQGKKGDLRPPSIVVSFVSRQMKVDWLAARRRKGTLSACELSRTFPDTQVYLNEHLTPQTRTIFNGARALIKQRILSSVWTSDCRVMARVSPDHRPFRIRDLQHVGELAAAPRTPIRQGGETPANASGK